MTALFAAHDLAIAFGGVKAVDGVSLSVSSGEILAVIGPNGAGKTTLFNIISGIYRPSHGRIIFNDQDIGALEPHQLARLGLARTFQNLQIFAGASAIENVMIGRHRHEQTHFLADLFALPASRRATRHSRQKARDLLAFVGLEKESDTRAAHLPYGALKRLEIARALASEPHLLLLDEPAAGCNAVETAQIDSLITAIAKRDIAIVLVEHDMRLVMKISHRILVLDRGRPLAEGKADEVRNNPAVITAYLGNFGANEAAHAAR